MNNVTQLCLKCVFGSQRFDSQVCVPVVCSWWCCFQLAFANPTSLLTVTIKQTQKPVTKWKARCKTAASSLPTVALCSVPDLPVSQRPVTWAMNDVVHSSNPVTKSARSCQPFFTVAADGFFLLLGCMLGLDKKFHFGYSLGFSCSTHLFPDATFPFTSHLNARSIIRSKRWHVFFLFLLLSRFTSSQLNGSLDSMMAALLSRLLSEHHGLMEAVSFLNHMCQSRMGHSRK